MFILTETVFKVLETHIYTHDDDPVPGDSWDETKKIENYGPYPTRIGAERKIKALARELIKKGMHGVKRYDGYLLTWPYNPRSHNQPPEEDDVILS
ncbi:MAG: hypothetical protein HY506_01820, partial [Candidatus Yanofskybacteria bacterium]|nr:hypothetical protein [Candidatus Yanofskybacteria bacterium]